MRRRSIWIVLILVAVGLGAAVFTRGMGFTARAKPWAIEQSTMLAARRWAIPAAVRRQESPVVGDKTAIRGGLEHWADHCASCHANDGSGDTTIGRNLYPPAPDMRERRTQGMTDGELFYVIERGIPLTGMPAWGTGTADGERASWELVAFIRHLPRLTEPELRDMEGLNPRSPRDAMHKMEIDDFLSGKKPIIRNK
jgi:mono/diheme cytochrome c family protein